MIIIDIFGTLNDWFNQRWLNNLRDQLSKVQGQQNRLLKIQMVGLHQIDEMEQIIKKHNS
jgi:hypothetical protein